MQLLPIFRTYYQSQTGVYTPSLPLPCFLSSTFRTISSYHSLISQPPRSITTFPCVFVVLLSFQICPELFPSLMFHLFPVIIYTQTFPFYFLYLISDHASKLFTCLFLLKLPYTHSWLEWGLNLVENDQTSTSGPNDRDLPTKI